jgi:hypothetical protein
MFISLSEACQVCSQLSGDMWPLFSGPLACRHLLDPDLNSPVRADTTARADEGRTLCLPASHFPVLAWRRSRAARNPHRVKRWVDQVFHGCDAVKPAVRICHPCSVWRTGQTFTGNQANRVRPDRRAIWSFQTNPLKPQQVLGCLAEGLFPDGCWFARSDWLCRD